MPTAQPHPLNRRAFVALLMACSFVWLPVAGLALHLTESASFQPTRHLFMTIHDIAAVVFLISATFHLKFNWKPLLNYLRVTAGKYGRFRQELVIAGLTMLVPLTLGVLHVFALRGGTP